MKLSMGIDYAMGIGYEVEDAKPEVEDLLEEVIAEEARAFVETLRQRLVAEGVRDIQMNVREA